MAQCCKCQHAPSAQGSAKGNVALPLICMVPRQSNGGQKVTQAGGGSAAPAGSGGHGNCELLDEDYIKKHFNLPKRALYLDPFRRPLITFPMTQEENMNFNLARKQKINQQILDGFLDPCEAITAPSVFVLDLYIYDNIHFDIVRHFGILPTAYHQAEPYAKTKADEGHKASNEDDEELIYILQLPDWEFTCPVHKETIRTPRFIWHSCKKTKEPASKGAKRGGGPLNKPKPWLLSRHTDFDLLSQW